MAPGGGQATVGVTVAANMDVSGVLNGVKSMQGAFNGLKLPANLTGDALKQFDKLKDSLTKYKELMEKGVNTKTDLKQLEKLEKTIKSSFSELSKVYDELSGKKIYLEADATAIKNAQKDIDQLKQDVQNKLGSIKFEFSSPTKGKVDIGLNELVSDMERAVKSSKTVSASMREMTNSVKSGNFTDAAKGLTQIEQQATKLKGASVGLLKTFQQMGLIQFNKSAEDLYKSGEHVSLLHQGFEKLRTVLSADDAELKQVTKSLSDAVDKKSELEKIGERNYNNNLAKQAQDANQLKQGYDQCAEAARGFAQQSMSAAQQVEQLQQSTQYFFSLRNMINLLKRGIDEAVQSVKELDKAMTETAVVTDYKVSDLWGMLPEYTRVANQLGATTQGAYETMTLYYQQGLEQQQAFELGAETMKMARIAGLDYAETTDMMTAALRGFNMELNETSAKRVNDVYSELAAITASDTEELGTAMQRTASIAASAGASFEGTTAFLAQAIETTREPAENIGTAMKTIVARFQEMKKNPLEISEVDGEEVDYNKIDAALKTIGVDLKDTNGQFREFDQVMLDISAKWDTLSQSQQRYIATTAAGSRQQSRFIAMVSNYDRTMQLMEAANNSAGASDEQFGKTMDSLESKLNQLHNAWQQFTMGIANNNMIKMAVDGLTGFLNITNKIIDTLSMGSGAIKSFLSIFAAFTGLKMAGRGANALIGGLGGLVDPKSSVKEGLKVGLFGQGKNANQAKAITTPIVGSLSKISGQIAAIAKRQGIKDAGQKGNTAGVKETSKEDYANTKRLFSQLSGKEGFKMGDTSNLFGKLDAKHQLSMFNNSPGTKLAMKQASLNWFNSKGLSKELTNEGKQFINSIYKGMSQGQIPVDKGIELIGQPQKWGQYFGTDMAKGFSSSFARESTQQAHQQAMQYLVGNPDAYGFRSNEFKDWYNNQATDAQKEAYAKYFRQAIDKRQGHGEAKGVVSDMGRFANDIGAVADKFTQAGYGISAFGNALSQLGGPLGVVGNGITAFGGAISTIGASISGATGLISLFTVGLTDATGAVVVAGSTIAAIAAPLAAAAGIFLLVRAHLKKVKEAGEEVTNTFKETSKTAEDNIAKIKSYQSEFATLSKGVDANGNNVSLDDSQYQRYLEIVDDIAAINPDIVEGYNAQGHAIINNNKALEETLKKQQQIKDEVYDTYTSEDSLQKLINARNINNDFKAINVKGESPSVYDGSGHGSEGRQKPIGLGRDVFNIVDQLRLNKDFDESSLQKYGIDSLDSLINGEEQAVKNFIKHRQQIQADLANSGLELNESIIKGFDKLGEDSAAFDAAIQPVYDNLLTNVSNSKVFKSIAPEFRNALNMGLKDLASQDLSGSEMIKAANNMAARFADLTTGSGKYQDALDKVEEAQQEFATTLNETEYKANVEPAIQDLIKLKQEALDEGSAYGDALAEYLENQIQRISNFTKEGGANLTEALNTATDEIAAAEGALDSFNEATKRDYSTAAEGMRSIFDKTTETYKDIYGSEIQKHAEGMGDATFWTGAEALLSGKEIERLTKGKDGYEAAEAVAKKIKGLEPMLREGQDGFDAFTDRVLENADAMDKLAEAGVTYDKESGLITNIPDDQWHNVAEALGISDDLLTSMLNKGRQFADISFMNVEDARKALAASDYSIKGTQAAPGEQQNLYVKEDTLRSELANAGYVRKDQQDEQIAKLLNEGVKTIPADASQLSPKDLDSMAKDWGVSTLPDLIQTLNETGDFTKDEIKNYADQLGLLGSDAQYDDLYSSIIEAAENPELVKQTGVLETISAQVAALADTRTGKEAKEDYDEAHKELVGGKGIDTQAQAFAKGKKLDENGKLVDLSAGEYEQTKASMQEVANSFRETAAIAAEKVKVTSGAEQDYWKQVQKGAEADAVRTDKYIQMADEAMKKRADAEKQETEGRQKEVEARNKARQAEQDAAEAAAKEANKNAQERGKTQTEHEQNKPVTESEGKTARDEGRIKEAQQQRQKELEEANKQRWEAENKRAQAAAAAEKKATEDKLKTQKTLQEQGEIEGQKLKQRYEAEEQARKRKNIEERSQLEGEKLAERARQEQEAQRQARLASQDQGRAQGRALSAEQTAVQAEDIQGKTDYLLRTSINTSLKTALDNLDPAQIASDPAQSQAFTNLYKDLINDSLPKAEDLQTLGIFGQLDSQYQDQITGALEEKTSILGEKISAAYQAFAQADKAALAMDVVPADDNVSKAITTVGQRLKSWWDKINNVNSEANTSSNIAPTVNTGAQAVANVAKNVAQESQSKFSVDTSESEAKLTNLKTQVDNTVSTIQQGATFKINVNDSGLTNAAKQAESLTKVSNNKNINVTANGAEGANKLSAAVKDFSKLSNKTINLTAKTSGLSGVQSLTSAVQAFHRLTDKTITLKTIKETITKGGSGEATGAHNHGYFSAPPKAGSAARGSYGQLGPKGKGGLTLTGELGYEIAWLPSENRSMILGANGPQMVNLPGDAVVWTHEQSKRILKQKSIPAGSHADMSANSSSYKKKGSTTTTTSGGGNKNTQNKDTDTKKATKQIEKTFKDIGDKVYKVTVWWENIARSTQDTQRIMDRAAKDFEKYTKDIRATLRKTGESVASGGGGGDDYIKNIKEYQKLNEQQRDRAKLELGALESSGLNKKATKKQRKKEYKKGNVAVEEISYKKGKKSKTDYVDLSKYIKNGQVDEKALKKIKSSSKRKAVAEAASKALNDERSKQYSAEDAIEKAQEALEKFGEELYNTFFAWENELTKIWNITQKIAEAENHINRAKSYTELLDAKVGSGIQKAVDVSQASIDAFSTQVQSQATNLQNNIEALGDERDDLRRTMSLADEKATLTAIQGYLKTNKGPDGRTLNKTDREGYLKWGEKLEKQINTLDDAWKYLTVTQREDGTLDTKFNTANFEADRQAGLINDEKAKTIQDYVKSMVEKSEAINNRIDTITSSTTEFYNELKTLKDEWAGYADQLWDISDAEQKKELDNFKKLSDSLDNAFKNLLDEIKRKLDERRQQEDNIKTERDISQKQQRLAMLQADTSGGHQVEIAQLQQEIANAQQDYQRSLEDQMLDKLQQQADQAAQQREQQIELQSATIDAINNASLVNQWLADPKNPDNKQAMYEAFMAANEADTKPDAIKEQLERQFEELYLGIITNKDKQDALYSSDQAQNQIINQIEDGTIKIANWSGQESGILDSIKAGIDGLNSSGSSVSLSNGGKVTEGGTKAISTPSTSNPAPAPAAKPNPLNAYKAKVQAAQSNKKMGADEFKSVVAHAKAAGISMTQMGKDLAKTKGLTWKQVVKAAKKAGYSKATVTSWWGNVSNKSKNVIKDWSKYATGGLADYTGPAWLDGTPSKPELVLNAKDTQNFLALRDVLSKAIGSTNSINNSYGGDNIFEINVNVDKIEKDYDVDRVIERVKKEITKGAGYRNVTQVRNFR